MIQMHIFCSLVRTTIICVTIFAVACIKPEGHSFHLFSYPPGSAPHEYNWEFSGAIYTYYYDPISTPSNKRFWITIHDRKDRQYLDDEFHIYGGQIWSMEEWNVFDSLLIMFYDVKDGEPTKIILDSTGDST